MDDALDRRKIVEDGQNPESGRKQEGEEAWK